MYFHTRQLRSAVFSFLLGSAALILTGECHAGLVIETPTVNVVPGSSGAFDVLLVDNDPTGTPGFHVAFASIELIAPAASGVSFTDISIATTAPYLFNPSGTTQGGGPFSFTTFPTNDVLASDGLLTSPYYQLVNPGDQFGLAHVSYTVSAGVPDQSVVFFVGTGTSLSDENGNGIPFTSMSTTVPEPSSLSLSALGMGLLFSVLGLRWRLQRSK